MCKFCLNFRLKFNVLMEKTPENMKTASLTQYLPSGFTCLNAENGFAELECIKSTRENPNCKYETLLKSADLDEEKHVKFHQFVTDDYTFSGKKDVTKTGTCTIRKQFEFTLISLKDSIDN